MCLPPPIMCQALWGIDRSHGLGTPCRNADKACAQISIMPGGKVGSTCVTLWLSYTVTLLVQLPEVMPSPLQGGPTRRPGVDMRLLIALILPSGISVCSVDILTHGHCCQPIAHTKATVTGHPGFWPCLTPLCVTKCVHTHTHTHD